MDKWRQSADVCNKSRKERQESVLWEKRLYNTVVEDKKFIQGVTIKSNPPSAIGARGIRIQKCEEAYRNIGGHCGCLSYRYGEPRNADHSIVADMQKTVVACRGSLRVTSTPTASIISQPVARESCAMVPFQTGRGEIITVELYVHWFREAIAPRSCCLALIVASSWMLFV